VYGCRRKILFSRNQGIKETPMFTAEGEKYDLGRLADLIDERLQIAYIGNT
jgi:hypothetical protein